MKTISTFVEYEKLVSTTAIYPNKGNNVVYPALGLCGEAGEVAEKIKKALRDEGGVISPERRSALLKELGDVLWYVTRLSAELHVSLEEVASANIEKLLGRHERGTLSGSGDDR
ncbi:nucleoside triphosphate pyrophosphohydrolase family protein [bacterium]|nr:nucleoside triphosphate pyrophosphohydrolase family protein [bacterium]